MPAAGKGLHMNFRELVGGHRSLQITPDAPSVPALVAPAPSPSGVVRFFLRSPPALV